MRHRLPWQVKSLTTSPKKAHPRSSTIESIDFRRALVTGGGGFLGLALVRRLIDLGVRVKSFSRSHYAALEYAGADQVSGDLADFDAVAEAVSENEIVFHVAALAGSWGPWKQYFATNIQGTRNILDACLEHGVGHLVYTSTPSVVFTGSDMENVDETVPYARHFEAHYPRSKAVAERAVLEANGDALRTVALRPHLIWGPGDTNLTPRIVSRADAGRLRRIGRDDCLIAPTYIDDAVAAHIAAAQALVHAPGYESAPCGQAYFVTSGETLSAWTMIDRLLEAAGREPLRKRVPPWLALAVGAGMELTYTLLGRDDEPPLTRWVVRELASSHWFDLSRSRRDLGYVPTASIDDGMAKLASSLAGAGPSPSTVEPETALE